MTDLLLTFQFLNTLSSVSGITLNASLNQYKK